MKVNRTFVDTSVIICLLVKDDGEKADKTMRLNNYFAFPQALSDRKLAKPDVRHESH